MPFLAILAAGMLAHALSSGFEYLYALRLVACAAALWVYRQPLAALDWRCSWRGAAGGRCGLWCLVRQARFTLPAADMPAALAHWAPVPARAWITLRALAAVADRAARRGTGLSRLPAAALPVRGIRFAGLPGRALARVAGHVALFGLSHGAMWPAGVVAGLVYGARRSAPAGWVKACWRMPRPMRCWPRRSCSRASGSTGEPGPPTGIASVPFRRMHPSHFPFAGVESGPPAASTRRLDHDQAHRHDSPLSGLSSASPRPSPHRDVPEIDPASAISGMSLLLGGLAVIRGRRAN